jgi:hypothetical protein
VTENKMGLPTATRVARTMREQIREELQLTSSNRANCSPVLVERSCCNGIQADRTRFCRKKLSKEKSCYLARLIRKDNPE